MSEKLDFINSCEKYIADNQLGISVEELFIQFQELVDTHKEFNKYLRESGYNEQLQKMQRKKQKLVRRSLFAKWNFYVNQNKKESKVLYIDVAEMIFASEKTVEQDLKKDFSLETTTKSM